MAGPVNAAVLLNRKASKGKAQLPLLFCRSMVICQDLLDCTHMLVIHHTDCGGQVLPASRCALQGLCRAFAMLTVHRADDTFPLRNLRCT